MSRLYTKKKQEFDDTVYGYLMKRLSMPITDTDAYHTGHVDEKGNELKAPDDWSYTRLDKLVFDLKAILGDRVKNLGKAYADVDAYVSDLALSAIWGDGPEDGIPEDRIQQLQAIYRAASMEVPEIAKAAGLNITQMSARFAVPYRTMQDWFSGARACSLANRLMMQECMGLYRPKID